MKTYFTKRLLGAAMILAMLFTMTMVGAFNAIAADPVEETGAYTVTFTQDGTDITTTGIEEVLFGTKIEDVTFAITLDKNNDHIGVQGFSPAASAPSLKVTSSDSKVVSATAVKTGGIVTAIHLVAQREGTATITLTVGKQTFTNATTKDKYTYEATEFTFDINVVEVETDVDVTDDPIVVFTTKGIANGSNGAPQYLAIDFANDKAVASAAIVAYSADGGTKWNALKEPIKKDATLNDTLTGADLSTAVGKGTDITKILDKGGNIMFTTKLDGKKAAAGATIWVAGEVAKRPKTPKLAAYYGIVDSEGKLTDPNSWTITVNGSLLTGEEDADEPVILFATAFGDGKTPDADKTSTKTLTINGVSNIPTPWLNTFGFKKFDFTNGYPVAKMAKATDKQEKFVFLARLAPVIEEDLTDPDNPVYSFTAGSKPSKLKVVGEQKPIKAKVDYKKETVSLKAGSAYYYDGAKDEEGNLATTNLGVIMTGKTGIPFNGNEEIAGIIDRTNPNEAATLTIWTEASGKKPRSMKSNILIWAYSSKLPAVADLTAGIKNPATEKAVFKLPKGYQVRGSADDAWGTTISVAVSADAAGEDTSNAWQVRKLGTAKYDAKNTTDWISDKKGTTTIPAKLTFDYKSVSTGSGDDKVTNFYLYKAKVAALSGSDTDAQKLTAAKSAVQSAIASLTVAQVDVNTDSAAKTHVEGIISGLSLNGVGAVVADADSNHFTAAVAGDVSDGDGTDGSYSFKVTLSIGEETPEVVTGTLTITATPYSE